jgi:hypothetical protein
MGQNPTGTAGPLRSDPVAGWGDDPVLEELRGLLADGWVATGTAQTREHDTVTVEKAGDRRELRSDHIAFHRFVEGLEEDNPKLRRR